MLFPIIVVLNLFFCFCTAQDPRTNVRISEIMVQAKKPSDLAFFKGYTHNNAFDYIEITNIGTKPVNMTGVKIAASVEFLFPRDYILAPGAFVLVVDNTAAFTYRYPTVSLSLIVGQWSGKLEPDQNLRLEYWGVPFMNFLLRDWYPTSNERGYSYVINSLTLPVDAWNQTQNWSLNEKGGSPGSLGRNCGLPLYSPATQTLFTTSTLTVTLTPVSNGQSGKIYYTLDGNTWPSKSSAVYTGPISLTGSARIKAMMILDNGIAGAIYTKSYIRIANDFVYSPGMSLMLIDTFGQNVDLDDEVLRNATLITLRTPNDVGGLSIADSQVERNIPVRMKVRGSSSAGLAKKAWKVEPLDEDGYPTAESLFGMPADSGWDFYAASAFDRARCKNPFVYSLNRLDFKTSWSSRTHPSELYLMLDGATTIDLRATGPHYWGIYQIEESIKRAPKRIDIAKMTPYDITPPNDTGGYIWKIDRTNPMGTDGFNAGAQNWVYVYPGIEYLQPAQRTYLTSFLTTWTNKIAAVSTDPNPNWLDDWDDIASIDHLLIDLYTQNVDAVVLSSYYNKQENGKFQFSPIWDYDRSMDCADDGRCGAPFSIGSLGRLYTGPPTWLGYAWKQPQFIRRYVNRYFQIRKDFFTPDKVAQRIMDACAPSTLPFPKDVAKWGFPARGNGTQLAEVQIMIDWTKNRIAYMDSGMCFNPLAPDAPVHCDDGNPCTDDVCDPSSCLEGPCAASAVRCINVPNGCVPACSAKGSDGKTCDDGNFCTTMDTCSKGQCVGKPVICNDNVNCTKDTCDPARGCVFTPDNNTCSDSNKCTENICNPTKGCQPVAKTCSSSLDGNNCKCLSPLCNSEFGCYLLPNNKICDDNNACTIDNCAYDTCCTNTPVVCPDDAIPCTILVCNTTTGCGFIGDNSMCDDGIQCTQDICQVGVGCVHKPMDSACNDKIACTVDVCSATTGCSNTPMNNFCDDKIACTIDTCDRAIGCRNDPSNILCDDKVTCTVDKCTAAVGCSSTPDNSRCDDSVSCTVDICDAKKDCQHNPSNALCDDKVSCTIDVCDATKDCQHTPTLSLCDDRISCTVDNCDPKNDCEHVAVDMLCNDNVYCTVDTCTNYGCTNRPDAGWCDDSVACTVDTCDPTAGCQHSLDDSSCDDGIDCTTNTCTSSGCDVQTDDSLCDDNDDCTRDSCNPLHGCLHPRTECGYCGAGCIAGAVVGSVVGAVIIVALAVALLGGAGGAGESPYTTL